MYFLIIPLRLFWQWTVVFQISLIDSRMTDGRIGFEIEQISILYRTNPRNPHKEILHTAYEPICCYTYDLIWSFYKIQFFVHFE